jgi:RNA polymerase sigma-B factor
VHIPDDERRRLRELFERYRTTGDPQVLDALTRGHLRLATHLARQFTNRGVAEEDLVQVACVALLGAIDRFDPDRGIEFTSFATPTILGALKRHFRDTGWSVRIPRRLQELNLQINHHVARLAQESGRSPTIRELARATGTSEEQVLEALDAAQAYRSSPLDPCPDAAARGTIDLAVDGDEFGVALDRIEVERVVAGLPPRQQLIVRLRFHEEMSQQEISQRLGISQMHVSRLLRRSLDELRRALDGQPSGT